MTKTFSTNKLQLVRRIFINVKMNTFLDDFSYQVFFRIAERESQKMKKGKKVREGKMNRKPGSHS